MPIQIKSGDTIAKKFAARAGAAGADYSAGVAAPRRPWAASTAAAAQTFAQGVQAAVTNGSFVKGVNAAGDAKWSRKASGVGAQRYPQGAQAAAPDYQAGVQPYLDVISNVQLPPRMPKGDPGNLARVTAVTSALRAKKLGK